jgi:hypothetical protein
MELDDIQRAQNTIIDLNIQVQAKICLQSVSI